MTILYESFEYPQTSHILDYDYRNSLSYYLPTTKTWTISDPLTMISLLFKCTSVLCPKQRDLWPNLLVWVYGMSPAHIICCIVVSCLSLAVTEEADRESVLRSELMTCEVKCEICNQWNTVQWLMEEGEGGKKCIGGDHNPNFKRN